MTEGNTQNLKKILIVDDDKSLLEMYSECFKSEGFQVLTAEDGERALALAVEEEPSVILLDIMMPKINGFNVLDIIKATPKTANIPIFIITAFIKEDYQRHALESGAVEFVPKAEITPSELVEKVKKVIGEQT